MSNRSGDKEKRNLAGGFVELTAEQLATVEGGCHKGQRSARSAPGAGQPPGGPGTGGAASVTPGGAPSAGAPGAPSLFLTVNVRG
jgi:hypothetical protein